MTRIRCRDRQCKFNKIGVCTSVEIEYEPDMGCLTMELREGKGNAEDDWEDEEEWEEDEEGEDDLYEEEDEDEDEDDWEKDGDPPAKPRGKKK